MSWCDFTTKSELISSKMAEPCRLSPNACAGKPALAPPEKPFALFFEISPHRDFFGNGKGCSGRVASAFGRQAA